MTPEELVQDVRHSGARALAITLLSTGFFFLLAYLILGLSLEDDTNTIAHSGALAAYWFTYLQEWSPLYLAWFIGLGRIIHDPYTLYFASWAIFAGCNILLPTLFRVPRAWMYALAVLAFPLLFAGPYSGLFGSCFVVFGLCILLRWRGSPAIAAVAVGVVSYPLSFVRPEFNYCVLIALPLAVLFFAYEVWTSQDRPGRLRKLAIATVCVAVSFVLASSTRNIMRHSARPRSGLAFAQHFAYRAFVSGEIPLTPDFENSDFAARKFGIALDARGYYGLTIADFFHANHQLFMRHALRNLITPGVLILLVVWACVLLQPWIRPSSVSLRAASVYVFVMSVPSFAGMILIYPREHYAAVFLPALLLLSTQLECFRNWIPPRLLPTLCLVFPFMAATYFLLPKHVYFVFADDQTARARISCIRKAESALPTGRSAFNGLGSYYAAGAIYLQPRNFSSPETLKTLQEFQTWTATQHPVWVALSPETTSALGTSSAAVHSSLVDKLQYEPYNCPAAANMSLYTLPR